MEQFKCSIYEKETPSNAPKASVEKRNADPPETPQCSFRPFCSSLNAPLETVARIFKPAIQEMSSGMDRKWKQKKVISSFV